MGSGRTIKHMGSEHTSIRMDPSTMATGLKINSMVRVTKFGLMAPPTKVVTYAAVNTVKEGSSGPTKVLTMDQL